MHSFIKQQIPTTMVCISINRLGQTTFEQPHEQIWTNRILAQSTLWFS